MSSGGKEEKSVDLFEHLNAQQCAQLERHHFARDTFLALRRRYIEGELSTASNRIRGEVTLPNAEDLVVVDEASEAERARWAERGRQALERGQVGSLVLNGGMATRFGGVVKGTVEVAEGDSFLGLKLKDARQWGKVPVLLMNSFATQDKTEEHLQAHHFFGLDERLVVPFTQNISIRLTPEGDLFCDEAGEVSLYAPGHGDLPSALQRGVLQQFLDEGGRYIVMSNVDNALATLDPVIIGAHVEASERGVAMSVENVARHAGDKGGMPARVNSHLQVVEAFRFPEGFNDSTIPVFNTNTFVFDAEALARDFDLSWFVVEKTVDERPAVQFERLAGELSAFLKTQFLEVSRQGVSSRFQPIKRPEDLEESRAEIRKILEERGII